MNLLQYSTLYAVSYLCIFSSFSLFVMCHSPIYTLIHTYIYTYIQCTYIYAYNNRRSYYFVFANVVILKCENDSKGKNRKLPCKICKVFCYQMPRHLKRQHSDHPEVAADLAKPGEGNILKRLINLGIFNHNTSVLQDKKGVFIVGRSSSVLHNVKDYLPCQYCFLFFLKDELWRHSTKCTFKDRLETSDTVQVDSHMLLLGALTADECGIDKILLQQVISTRMRKDRLTTEAKCDVLITHFGSSLLQRLGPKRANDIAQRMRQLARLRIQLMKLKNEPNVNISQFLSGPGFDYIIKAIEAECEFYLDGNGRRLYKNHSLALKLGHSLHKCAQLKRGMCIRSGDTASLKDAEYFLALHNAEFTDRVSSPALAAQRLKSNTLREFPDESDLQKLKLYQLQMIDKLISAVEENNSLWRELAEITLSRLIVFNGRRGSEVSQLLMSDYLNKEASISNKSMVESMSEVERQLTARYATTNTHFIFNFL